jgi:hypothetical protein
MARGRSRSSLPIQRGLWHFLKSGKTLNDLRQPSAIIRDCDHICARGTPLLEAKVVPTSRAGGTGGEAGTGSWERAGPSLLPWAAETPHKVVNTINGAALVGGPFFWPPLDRTSCASERGYCSAGATVFRSAVALALAPVPFAYPGGWGLNPSGCSSPDILRSPPNRASQTALLAASRNRA